MKGGQEEVGAGFSQGAQEAGCLTRDEEAMVDRTASEALCRCNPVPPCPWPCYFFELSVGLMWECLSTYKNKP